MRRCGSRRSSACAAGLLSSVPGFPATCVIDAEGALDAAFLGAPDGEAVERIVARIESLGAR